MTRHLAILAPLAAIAYALAAYVVPTLTDAAQQLAP